MQQSATFRRLRRPHLRTLPECSIWKPINTRANQTLGAVFNKQTPELAVFNKQTPELTVFKKQPPELEAPCSEFSPTIETSFHSIRTIVWFLVRVSKVSHTVKTHLVGTKSLSLVPPSSTIVILRLLESVSFNKHLAQLALLQHRVSFASQVNLGTWTESGRERPFLTRANN